MELLARSSVAPSLRIYANQSFALRQFPAATSETASQSEWNFSDTLRPLISEMALPEPFPVHLTGKWRILGLGGNTDFGIRDLT